MPIPGEQRAAKDLRGKDTENIERLSLHTDQYVNRGKKKVAERRLERNHNLVLS